MIEDDQDRATFLDTAEFGEEVTYTPRGATAFALQGQFFQNAERTLDDVTDAGVVSNVPMYEALESAVPGAAKGDQLIRPNGVRYTVQTPDKTGNGFIRLWLAKAGRS